MEFKKQDIFTVPNILTYIRLLFVPAFIAVMLLEYFGIFAYGIYTGFAIFVVAEITDLLDGWIARKFNQISDIGKVLDPVADKALQIAAVICLTVVGNVHLAFTVLIVVKELYMILGGALILKVSGKKVEISANIWGKVASALLAVGYALAFGHNIPGLKNLFYIDWAVIGVGCFFAIAAAVIYTVQMVKATKKVVEEEAADLKKGDTE